MDSLIGKTKIGAINTTVPFPNESDFLAPAATNGPCSIASRGKREKEGNYLLLKTLWKWTAIFWGLDNGS